MWSVLIYSATDDLIILVPTLNNMKFGNISYGQRVINDNILKVAKKGSESQKFKKTQEASATFVLETQHK